MWNHAKEGAVTASDFTDRQRRIVLLLVFVVAGVLALIAGFIVTSLENFDCAAAVVTASPANTSGAPAADTPLATATPTRAATSVPQEGIWTQVRAARLFEQIAHQVAMDRDLSPRAEVPLSFLNEVKMASMLRQRYAERDFESELLPYAALDLVPRSSISIEVRVPAAIYVSEQEQLYVATDQPESDGDAQTLLAHAYVHALQDQHFGLEAIGDRARTVDEELAAQALIAGDATLTTALYRYRDLSSADWTWLTDLIVEAEHPRYSDELASIEAWRRLERFANQEGRLFVHELLEAGGWDAVNQAYVDPPRSTEQILHPDRYFEPRDEPTEVVVPDIGGVLGQGWRKVLEDTLGELVVGLYLNEDLPEETIWQAAEGWDGDTFAVWEREDGRRVVVWRTAWDSSGDAAEFENSLVRLIAQRHFPVRPFSPPRGLTGHWWGTPTGIFHVVRTARHVGFLQAPDEDTAVNVASVLP